MISDVVRQLECAFIKINNRYFDGILPLPVITVSPDTTKGAYGWCTAWKAWTGGLKGGQYEINICSEYLDRDKQEVLGTLHHEMIHLYNLEKGVKDTSRGGMYHNRKFKFACELHGLVCEETEKYGYSKTSIPDDTLEFYESIKLETHLKRDKNVRKRNSSKKQSMRKYICPNCGLMIRATKEVKVICGECYERGEILRMEVEQDEEE